MVKEMKEEEKKTTKFIKFSTIVSKFIYVLSLFVRSFVFFNMIFISSKMSERVRLFWCEACVKKFHFDSNPN